MATSFQTTLQVDVTESEQSDSRAGEGAHESPPAARNIRRSLSPLLDFSGRPGSGLGDRRNFCNISECSFCKPLTDNHRLSPLRSPVISPSSRRGIFSHNSNGPKQKSFIVDRLLLRRDPAISKDQSAGWHFGRLIAFQFCMMARLSLFYCLPFIMALWSLFGKASGGEKRRTWWLVYFIYFLFFFALVSWDAGRCSWRDVDKHSAELGPLSGSRPAIDGLFPPPFPKIRKIRRWFFVRQNSISRRPILLMSLAWLRRNRVPVYTLCCPYCHVSWSFPSWPFQFREATASALSNSRRYK